MTDVHDTPGDSPARAPRRHKQEQEPASETITEVAPDIIRMQLPIWMPGLGHVNMYGLLDDRGLAVVDPGLPGPQSWKALKKRLRDAGFRLRDVHTVLVTHSHPDHFGGAGRLAKEADAQLVTHAAFTTWHTRTRRRAVYGATEALATEQDAAALAQELDVSPDEMIPTIEEHVDDYSGDPLRAEPTQELQRTQHGHVARTPWGSTRDNGIGLRRRLSIKLMRLLFTPPDPTRRVRHEERLQLAGREWVSLHTPGHTVDHLCAYDPEHGVLLSGDHVLPSITPHISGMANGVDSLKSYITTLDLVAALDGVRLGLPAHGHPFDDVPGRVDAIKRHHEERMEHLRAASIAIGPATVEDLCHEVFPRKHWGLMAESETFAHLEHLALAGRAERWWEHGKLYYRVA